MGIRSTAVACQKMKKNRLFHRAIDEAMMTARAKLLKEIQAGTSSGTWIFLAGKPKTFGFKAGPFFFFF